MDVARFRRSHRHGAGGPISAGYRADGDDRRTGSTGGDVAVAVHRRHGGVAGAPDHTLIGGIGGLDRCDQSLRLSYRQCQAGFIQRNPPDRDRGINWRRRRRVLLPAGVDGGIFLEHGGRRDFRAAAGAPAGEAVAGTGRRGQGTQGPGRSRFAAGRENRTAAGIECDRVACYLISHGVGGKLCGVDVEEAVSRVRIDFPIRISTGGFAAQFFQRCRAASMIAQNIDFICVLPAEIEGDHDFYHIFC